MSLGLNKVRIQNALVAAGKAGVFFAVAAAPDTGAFSADTTKPILPVSAFANELRATFDTALNKRDFIDDRKAWSWELRLEFNVQAACEVFEETLTKKPLFVPRDTANGFDRQVLIRLRNAVYRHPPEQQPMQGTRVVYTFEATLSPL